MGEPALASIEERTQGYERARNDLDLSREYHISTLHSLYKRYLKALLLISGWDLFAVYKNNNGRTGSGAKYDTLYPPEL